MPKTENELKTALVKALRKEGFYARRIEDQYGVGIFDLMIGIPFGPAVACEAKRVEHQSFGPTPRQWIELQDYQRNGGMSRVSWILGFKEGIMYLHTAVASVKIGDCCKQDVGETPGDFFKRFWQECRMIGA